MSNAIYGDQNLEFVVLKEEKKIYMTELMIRSIHVSLI